MVVRGWKISILAIIIITLYTIPIYASQETVSIKANQKSNVISEQQDNMGVVDWTGSIPSIQTISVQAQPGENITVPIMLKNNPGIMGLGLTVNYNEELWNPKSVTRSELLQNGNLTDSIGTEKLSGKVKILWSDTAELKGDGEILEVELEPLENDVFTDTIQIVCSTPDTFRESWEEVTFSPTSCEIVVKVNEVEVVHSTAKEIMNQADKTGISQEKIEEKIQTKVEELGYSQLSEIKEEKEKKEIAEKVTKELNAVGLGDEEEQLSFEVVENLYDTVSKEKEQQKLQTSIEVRDRLNKTITKDKLKDIFDQSLKKSGMSGFQELSEEQGKVFLEQLNKQFMLEEFDLQKELEGYSDEEKLEMLKLIYEDATGVTSLEMQQVQGSEKSARNYLVVGTCGAALIFVILVLALRRKKMKK